MILNDQPTIFGDRVSVVVSSRQDGTVKFGADTSDEAVAGNLERIVAAAHLDCSRVVGVAVTYKPNRTYDVIRHCNGTNVDVRQRSTWVKCDALITSSPGVGLFLPVADCNAVVVYDPNNKVLALAHIGWHAAQAHLATKLIAHMVREFSSKPTALLCYISPSIRQESYYHSQLAQIGNPDWKAYIDKRGARYYLDILGFARDELLYAGILQSNLEISPIDVAKSKDYYSHFSEKHKSKHAGRFGVLAAMND